MTGNAGKNRSILSANPSSAITSDSFFDGQVKIFQDQDGYRFSIDPVILAFHCKPRKQEKIIDLGTGCGIIPIIFAIRFPDNPIYGIEIQSPLADLAIRNVTENKLQKKIQILCQDMTRLSVNEISGPADFIVCNPPFRKLNSGRINPVEQRAVARHEIKTNLSEILRTAQRILKIGGRIALIYPGERMAELLIRMHSTGIEPKKVRSIHSKAGDEAKLIVVQGKKGGRPGIRIEPPFIIYNDKGEYTGEAEKMFMP